MNRKTKLDKTAAAAVFGAFTELHKQFTTNECSVQSSSEQLMNAEGAATQSNVSIIDAHQPRVKHALTLGVATQGRVNF